jgi:flavin-dependent dehydrogenase
VADRPPVQRTLHLEYRFDRWLAEKLEQAYELLIPDKRWPAAGEPASRQEVVNEETGRPVRTRII